MLARCLIPLIGRTTGTYTTTAVVAVAPPSMDRNQPPTAQEDRQLPLLASEGAPETKDLLETASLTAAPEGGVAAADKLRCNPLPDTYAAHDDKLPTVCPPGYSCDDS